MKLHTVEELLSGGCNSYTISRPGEPSLKRRLCIIKDKKKIATLKKQAA
eukprot:COSAG06_NODE_21406_length_758_cov_0.931715_2_plen_48_part_01